MALQGGGKYVTELKTPDVLFGRGSGPNDHEGNVRFRLYVAERKVAYMATNHRMTKTKIAREIVDLVVVDGGRFLKKIESKDFIESLGLPEGSDCYEVVDDDTIMEKAKQALRQNASKVREEVEAAKKQLGGNIPSSTTISPTHRHPTHCLPEHATSHQQHPPVMQPDDFEPLPLTTQQPSYPMTTAPLPGGGMRQQPMASQPISEHYPEQNWNDPVIGVGEPNAVPSQQQQPPPHPQQRHHQQNIQMDPNYVLMESSQAAQYHSPQMPPQRPNQGHRGTQSEPPVGYETSNYSMAMLPNEEAFGENRLGSLTLSDIERNHNRTQQQGIPASGSVVSGSSNSTAQMQQASMRRPGSPSMDELMDSFTQMHTGPGKLDNDHRKMMASTETMGTIEPMGSVADMSLGSSTFSLFRGNDSLALPDDGKHQFYPGLEASSSAGFGAPSATIVNPDHLTSMTTIGTTRSSNKSFDSIPSITFDQLHGDANAKKKPSNSTSTNSMSQSINGIISEVRKQVESEYPSAGTLPRAVGIMEETPDDLNMESMGDSSISVLKTVIKLDDEDAAAAGKEGEAADTACDKKTDA